MTPVRTAMAVVCAAAVSWGCIGELRIEDDTPAVPDAADAGASAGDTEPSTMFTSAVQPIVSRCGGASCHTGTGAPLKFLGSDSPADDYASITSFPSVTGGFDPDLANLLLKIGGNTHYGMSYSAAERDAIVAWLDAELIARTDVPDPDQPPPEQQDSALAAWSGCMTKANWDAAQMGSWSDKDAEGGDECSTCHNDGAFRFNTNADNEQMFTMNRNQLYIIGFFTVEVAPDGTETVIPAYQKLERMGNGSTLHPRFGYGPGDTYFERLEQFYQLTLETQQAGACGPAVF